MKSCATIVLATSLAVFGFSLASRGHAADVVWSAEGAAAYLDLRMDAWFTNATKLRTGDGRTACVSCHTPLPYALARPALRRTMGVASPTPQEARLADETARRVNTIASQQLLYEFDEEKKGESQGTEAVLHAIILASAGPRPRDAEAAQTLQKALARLWETQRADGTWEWLDFGLEPFESIDGPYHAATLAALAIGGVADVMSADPTTGEHVDRLRQYIRREFPTQHLYNRTWTMLAGARLKDLLSGRDRESLVTELVRRQRADGGWSLSELGPWRWNRQAPPFAAPSRLDASIVETSDGYATGLVVYTLIQNGIGDSEPSVARGLSWLRTNQRPVRVGDREPPAWRAHSLNYDREHGGEKGEAWRRLFMSDAATAFAVLALTSAR